MMKTRRSRVQENKINDTSEKKPQPEKEGNGKKRKFSEFKENAEGSGTEELDKKQKATAKKLKKNIENSAKKEENKKKAENTPGKKKNQAEEKVAPEKSNRKSIVKQENDKGESKKAEVSQSSRKEKSQQRSAKSGVETKKGKPQKKSAENTKKSRKVDSDEDDDDDESEDFEESDYSVSDDKKSSSSESFSGLEEESNSLEDEDSDSDDDDNRRAKRGKNKTARKTRKSNNQNSTRRRRQTGNKGSLNRPPPKLQLNEESKEEAKADQVVMRETEKVPGEEEIEIVEGLSTPKRRMFEFVDEVKDGPWFTQKQYIRDAEGRRPDDPDYDPTTIFIPEEEFNNMTPGMQRYWEIKGRNFDKVVFYRWGEWFILYFQDASICSKILDLCIPPRQLQRMIGFHQSHLKENIEKLVASGYKVAIAEQTETCKMMEKRISQSNEDNELKVVRREVAQIYSTGTFFNTSGDQDYDTKYVLAFCQDKHKFGFCYFDFSTLKFYLGSFEDDFTLKQFRTLCLQTRPVEAICPSNANQKSEAMMILKNSPSPPSFTFVSMYDICHDDKILEKFSKYFGEDQSQWPDAIKKIVNGNVQSMAMTALAIAILYLEQLLQAEVTIPVADFYAHDEQSNQELMKTGSMVIDAQAIEHLELLEIPGRSRNHKEGSFFNFIAKGCSTAFGKRMLKRWVVGPLKDPKKINDRLDAVTDLVRETMLRDKLQAKFKKLPDLERMLSRIYTYSQESTVKAIYIDIAVISRLDEFHTLLNTLTKLHQILSEVFDKDSIKLLRSKRLKALVQFAKVKTEAQTKKAKNRRRSLHDDDENAEEEKKEEDKQTAIFPDFGPVIEEFSNMIQWKSVGNKKIPEPVKGLDEEFDQANEKVEQIKQELEDYLEKVRKQLKSRNVNYTTLSKRFRYELEMPEEMNKKVTEDYINTSNVKGKKRYQTDELRGMIEDLEEAEDKFKDALIPFLRSMFKKFYEKRDLFSKAVQCAAELDCLCALSVISADDEYGPMCRPEIIEDNGDEPYIELRQMRHPCVQEQMAKSNLLSYAPPKKFVPNDVIMGSYKKGGDTNPRILLITGPNMGGKSTLLRQTCLAAIMAQIGCYVPAKTCRLTIVDRVFTRIGASDRILENKSTFFVELEETKTIVEQATKNSLVIMDELGRGTSTFDGYSIAHSVLSYITNTIKCRTLFTTHYHMLVEDFREMQDMVGLFHMKSSYEEHSDTVKFLYQFVPGVSPESFGIYVAKMAGINDDVLKTASKMSQLFNTKIDKLTKQVRAIRLK